MDPVVHFELPAKDMDRMVKFYSETFGWKTQKMGPEMGNYVVVSTTEMNSDGWPTKPGRINGGFYDKGNDPKTQHPSVVIGVEDINESINKVKKSGGKIVNNPTEIPGVGIYCSIQDTEGNYISMLQPFMNKKENSREK